ncbi:unnamed protein product [Camellia sinensis]
MKVIEKIREAEGGDRVVFSFEFFPPKTEDGVDNLFERMERMVIHNPSFCDITWGAGGSTADLTLEISNRIQNMNANSCPVGVPRLLHMPGGPKNEICKTVSQIKDEGLGRTDKPDWVTVKASISFIKTDTFCYTACPLMIGDRHSLQRHPSVQRQKLHYFQLSTRLSCAVPLLAMRWRSSSSSHLRLSLLSIFFFLSLTWLSSPSLAIAVAVSDQFDGPNTTESSNVSRSRPREDSFAGIIDRALEKEFTESDQTEGSNDAGSFNNSVAEQQAVLETVARVKPFQLHHVFNLDNDHRAEDTPTLIDRKVKLDRWTPTYSLDLRLISDLVVVIVSATCGGIAFACAGQPVITGYLLAGSAVGPGGLSFVSEMVQVETVAQFGVIFLLFALGLEFSTTKLCGGKLSEGVFVGTFLSMSSIAVVLKFLMEKNSTNALHGQVTIGTLILQDCAVGLLFALLPVLGGTSGVLQGIISMTKSLVVLILFLAVLSILSRTCVPWFLKLMISLSSQTNELYQLAAVAFCLLVAWCSDKLGLSLELGSFAAGVMISTTDLAQHTLEQVEPIRNFFAALFLASIGMLIHVHFLWNHVDILLASVLLVIIVKTIVITIVVKGFSYNYKTSLLVGMSLAQIGEFAFVLLSRASNLHLVEIMFEKLYGFPPCKEKVGKLYLLLLGTTALSLVTTPLLFKLIPAVVHLGVLLRWFSPDSPSEIGFKGENLRSESAKQRIALITKDLIHEG